MHWTRDTKYMQICPRGGVETFPRVLKNLARLSAKTFFSSYEKPCSILTNVLRAERSIRLI